MNKENAKNILSDIYSETLGHLEAQGQEIDEALLINFLNAVARSLLKNDFQPPVNFSLQQQIFEDEYKELAQESLNSYNMSNEKFAALTKEQQDALNQFDETLIDARDITERFSNIQNHLSGEVERANETINRLISRVKDLENQSSIDSLTKVYNRRAMESYLAQICGIDSHPVMMHLFMIDVDDFKTINDSYGHLIGDKVLIYLANLLKSTLREGDKIFRYGGEEFIVILNRISDEGCKQIAERILTLVRNSKLNFKEHQITFTLSIGATQLKPADTMERLISRADKALYRAKHSGKDQMEVETVNGI